jgi:hypothetical protein
MRSIILFACIALASTGAYAQGSFAVSYPISFPMGNLHDYTTNVSFRGINMEFLKRANPRTVVGLETGWNVFYQSVDSKPYHQGNATITGKQYRYTNVAPILAEAKFYPASSGKTAKPYAGLGVGTLYANRSTDFGLYRITNEAWQFCLRPEVGIDFKAGPGVAGFLGVKYYWAFNAHDLDGQPFLSINIGIKASAF